MKNMIRALFIVPALSVGTPASAAALSLDPPLGAHMVLQRERPIHVCGTAPPGAVVEVVFGPQRKVAQTARDGRWRVVLDALPAEAGRMLTVACGTDTLRLCDVAVGEVWLAGGQSNMTFRAGSLLPADYAALRSRATPLVRSYNVAQVVRGGELLSERDAPWASFTPDAIGGWSAVATFFAAELAERYGIPVGIVHCSHGASTAESWISPAYYAAHPEAVAAQLPSKPATDVMHRVTNPSQLYEAMLRRIENYPVRGVIWYQGESNAAHPDGYRTVFAALIDCWRENRQDPALPFVFAQLSSYDRRDTRGNTTWAIVREAQRCVARTVPYVAMTVTCDAGEAHDIHPKDKRTVAHRLVLAARRMVYGDKVCSEGPRLRRAKRRGDRVVLSFRGADGGLTLRRPASGFALCGAQGVFHPAAARVRRRRIVLRSDSVVAPQAVRYAWRNAATLSVYNAAGLPLSPFEAACRRRAGR